jgi:DNA topoisomerase-1
MAVSSATISQAEDRELDKTTSKAKSLPEGLSIRNGPVLEESTTNGAAKRKSRASNASAVNYKDESDSDGAPLVGLVGNALWIGS